MSQMAKFFEDFQNEILLSINTLAPAKVLSYDPDKKIASLQPLFLIANKYDSLYKQSPISEVPVLKHCQADIKVGSLVFYMPTQRSISDLDGTNFIDPDSFDFFSGIDAVVIGVY